MNVTGASVTIELQGNDYELYPLNDKAYGRLTLWVRADFMLAVRLSLEGADDEVWSRGMSLAFEKAMSIDCLTKEGVNALMSFGGQCVLLRESLRPDMPSIELSTCNRLLSGEGGKPCSESIGRFSLLFGLVNDVPFGKTPANGRPVLQTFEESRQAIYKRTFDETGQLPTELSELTPSQFKALNEQPRFQTFETQAEHDQATRN